MAKLLSFLFGRTKKQRLVYLAGAAIVGGGSALLAKDINREEEGGSYPILEATESLEPISIPLAALGGVMFWACLYTLTMAAKGLRTYASREPECV